MNTKFLSRKQRIDLSIFVLVIIAVNLLMRYVLIPGQIKRENLFYKSEINNGIIKYAEPAKGASRFKIEGRDTVYEFSPEMNAILNGEQSFHSVAVPGDTVIKHAYSDTLTLIHKRRIYRYAY